MQIYERIKFLRKKHGLSAETVAEAIGVSRATVYRYETKDIENMPIIVLEPLAKVLHCTPAYLMGWEEERETPKYPPQLNTIITKAQQLNSKGLDELGKHTDLLLLKEEYRKNVEFAQELSIPSRIIQYFQSVSAETGQVIFDDVYSERITIPDIPEHRRVAYAVKVSGHSMEPLYQDGDMLLIEPACSVDIGEIGIFNVDGQAYVKKLGKRELISLNAGYENIALTDDSRCMGRVVDKFSDK